MATHAQISKLADALQEQAHQHLVDWLAGRSRAPRRLAEVVGDEQSGDALVDGIRRVALETNSFDLYYAAEQLAGSVREAQQSVQIEPDALVRVAVAAWNTGVIDGEQR